MELTDRQNWALSTTVGILLAANGILWAPRADIFLDWVMVIALAVGGLMAMANGIRALRDPENIEPMEWTTWKTTINLGASVLLSVAAVGQIGLYL